MHLHVEWSRERALSNLQGHGVSFSEAATVFGDPLSRTIADPHHALDRSRFMTLGLSQRARMLVVRHVQHGCAIWIVEARRAMRTTSPPARRSAMATSSIPAPSPIEADFSHGVRGKYSAGYWEAASEGRLTRARDVPITSGPAGDSSESTARSSD